MVDCDSQCNLTAYAMTDSAIRHSWSEDGNSIFRVIEAVNNGTGDIKKRKPAKINETLFLVPGDVDLSNFEDRLGETWGSASTQELSLRTQIAIYRYVNWIVETNNIEYVFYDLGPNLGAINRSVLGGCCYFITPLSPDLFSIKGTQNLGNKFMKWSKEWSYIISNWEGDSPVLPLPLTNPKFVGYVVQQHNIRSNAAGMTQGWQIFGNVIDEAVKQNIVDKLMKMNQVVVRDNYELGAIPNLHSLIPYSLEAKKPVYKCTSADGLKGAHISSAKNSARYYDDIISIIESLRDV